MSFVGLWRLLFSGILLWSSLFGLHAYAGGSGLNTLVVINQNSPDSIELGNYFSERRRVPPENIVRISWPGGNTYWDSTQFQTNLLQPVLQAIAARGLTNQIHYVVLSMDIPYQTVNDVLGNGTTSGLYYGIKSGTGIGSLAITNSYFASESPFPDAKPASAPGYSFLTTMITAGSLAQAKQLVDHGVDSDATFPTASVVLAKSSDPLRNIRYRMFDNAIFNTRLRGDYSATRTNLDWPSSLTSLLGFETGLMTLSMSPNAFVPGAMADSLTSFGGGIFGYNEQTSLLAFIHAGAAGGYGTVSEPSPALEKFPSPQNYFYQARGFSLAECYYQSLESPYQGLVVGEPLAAPFARSGSGLWVGIDPGDVLNGMSQLTVQFTASDAGRPLQQMDLFVDGKFFKTITNIAPAAGNQIALKVNGKSVQYTVPANATLSSIASGLAVTMNSPAISNATQTIATAFGDRVQVRYLGTNRPLSPSNLGISPTASGNSGTNNGPPFSTTAGSAGVTTTFLKPARMNFLDSSAYGLHSCSVGGMVQIGTWLKLTLTKTNGSIATVAVTNQIADGTPGDLANALVSLINSSPGMQTGDGVIAEDVYAGFFGATTFNLRARSPGLRAAGAKVVLSTSGGLALNPAATVMLTENLTDLQPRNHFYITAGATQLTARFTLNTTTLDDGWHELTAVAYEGSHVRTQTRVQLPVRVQNISLAATLTFVDMVATNSVSGSYQIQVEANINDISSITLFSTGGVLATVTNQSAVTFNFQGTTLGAGLHSFFAVVQNGSGQRYRTATQTARFVNP
ncbi:MAG: TIGR03790 family protein [Verrucomicrobia bacterium]|nr:TIGR03790 family protein [Verrucomicrobiota bacterium]